LGQYQRAIQDYDIAISLNLRYALAYSNRGIAFAKLGQAGNAKVDLGKAFQLDQKYC
jgi:Flp pilus assembly protein TadD